MRNKTFPFKESEALDHVFGYTVAHDVSARDWQLRKNNGQWGLGKSFDTFCPLGPAIVHKSSLSGKTIAAQCYGCLRRRRGIV